jgi:hypothetical protein
MIFNGVTLLDLENKGNFLYMVHGVVLNACQKNLEVESRKFTLVQVG